MQTIPSPAGPDFRRFRKEEIEQSVPSRFEEQVRLHPGRLAVKEGAEAVTYEQLNERANRIAREILLRRGSGEEPVGVLLDTGVNSIATILGALKAGKIFVPLDPSAPGSQVVRTVKESRSELLVTRLEHEEFAAACVPDPEKLIVLERMPDVPAEEPPRPELSPDRLAYIFFTSGATGPPKGVVDSHRHLLHNVMRYTNSLAVTRHDRLTLLQGPAFSGALSNIFVALLNGAAVLPFDPRRHPPDEVAWWLSAERVTIYHSVPSLFGAVMEWAGDLPHLRVVRLEGDRCTAREVGISRDKLPDGCVLVNGLGATETGISCQYFMDRAVPLPGPTVPVGYPTEDFAVRVAGPDGRALPAGEVGEIVVTSRYLARGYWSRPDLTERRFRAGPDGERSFLSGDVGRVLPDGSLEHLGRSDFQMRFRGLSVDAPSVEAALEALPEVREARVQVRTDGGHDGIVGYIVPAGPRLPTAGAIRQCLQASLPEHAVPGRYVILSSLPLDENGKVDVRRLPPPGRRPDLLGDYVPARTAIEKVLAGVWSEVLGVSPVGIDDDFLDLGGDSLRAGTIVARLRARLPVDVPLRLLFDERTIARLAEAIQRRAAARS